MIKVLVPICRQIVNLLGHVAIVDLAVRGFNESEFVDPCERAQRADQTDVRTFRRFNRADAPVVRGMNVAHLESGAVTAETRLVRAPTDGACASAPRADSSDP